jgi:membrane protease YdiL (CAAX protease family)
MAVAIEDPKHFPLTKLVYALSAAALVVSLVSGLISGVLLASFRSGSKLIQLRGTLAENAYPVFLLSYLLVMIGVIWWYRRSRPVLQWRVSTGTFPSIVIGMVAGIVLSSVACALSYYRPDLALRALLVSRAASILGLLELVLLVVALPVAGELVFRGIVFRTLCEHVSVPAAVIGSTLAFAYLSPVFDAPTRILLGLGSAALFYKTRNLASSIAANIVMTCCVCAFILFRGLHTL